MKILLKHFNLGLHKMNKLVMFVLHNDCENQLLVTLAENAHHCLRSLDIEQSKNVTDDAACILVKFKHLVELNIFECGLSGEAQAHVIKGLPQLLHLKRGDFLCEALDWLDYLIVENEDSISLNLREFYHSESYHFHTVDQMKLVRKWPKKTF